jgi:hypothetical protein
MAFAPAALADKPETNPGAGDEHADQGNHGKPDKPDKAKNVAYVFKGTYSGDSSVAVTKGNRHVRKAELVDTTVAFDLTNAKVTVADTNADGTADINDVAVGDKVVVKAKLAKPDPGAQPFAAKHLVDQTNPPADEEETEPTT